MARERKFTIEELFSETEKLLLQSGYEGFTIGQLAKQLNISRPAIYKYYSNKESLILDYMVHLMEGFVTKIELVSRGKSFEEQLEILLQLIFQYKDIHQILGQIHLINDYNDEGLFIKKEKIQQFHRAMYPPLIQMIDLGKKEGFIKTSLSSTLVLSFIFQSITVPNVEQCSDEQFLCTIKELICNGIKI